MARKKTRKKEPPRNRKTKAAAASGKKTRTTSSKLSSQKQTQKTDAARSRAQSLLARIKQIKFSQEWFSWLVLIAVGILLFYPPYFRGLFFDQELLPTHVITAIIYGLVWADKFRRKDLRFIQNPLDWAVLAYAGAYLLSLFGAVHMGDAIKGFLKALNYFMVYWMVTQVVRDHRSYETILRILFASALGVAAIGIAAATGFSNYPGAFENGRIMSTLQYPNTTATYMAVMSLIGITLWIRERNFFFRLLYGLGTTVMMLIAIVAVSKGGWIVLAVGGLLLLLGMPGIYRVKSMYSLLAALGAAAIATVKFLPAIQAGENTPAFQSLVLAAVIVIIAQLIWEGLEFCYKRKGTWITVGAATLVLAGGIALLVQSGLPARVSPEVMPTTLVQRFAGLGDTSDFSYASRMEFSRTALAIVKDHPLVGTGAGGWNALYHQYLGFPYWTTEVHNHFLQVGVEAGTIGFMAFLAMWALLLYNLFRLYRARPRSDEWAANWGVAAAVLAFGAHSAIDFDLSLAAMALILWSLLGLNAAGCRISTSTKEPAAKTEPLWIQVTAMSLILVLLIPGACFARACTLGDDGVAYINDKKLDQAEECLERAVELNPWDGASQARLANIQAVKYQVLQQNNYPGADQYRSLALATARKAQSLRPYDIRTLQELRQVYGITGDGQGQVQLLEMSLQANPLDAMNYQNLAQGYFIIARLYIDEGNHHEAATYLEKVLQVSSDLDSKLAKVTATYPHIMSSLYRPRQMDLTKGQAFFLQGEYSQAIEVLTLATLNQNLVLEANTWKAAALYKMGEKKRAAGLINELAATDKKYWAEYKTLISIEPISA
jgi:tetratricopeptide (TPR) repeat protein